MEVLQNHLKKTRRNQIFWLLFSKITYLPLIILVVYFVTGFVIILVFFFIILLLLYLTTFRIWRDIFNKKSKEANQFIQILESKTTNLRKCFCEILAIQFPKQIYWIDFKIDPSTFQIVMSTHSTDSNSLVELSAINNEFMNMLKIDKHSVLEYKKIGWEADENLELSLQLTQRWLAEIWNQEITKEFKIRATFSVLNRDGYFDLKTNKWEETNIFFGEPLK